MSEPTPEAVRRAEKIVAVFAPALRRAGDAPINDAIEKNLIHAIAVALPQWRPIATAPKSLRTVLLLDPDGAWLAGYYGTPRYSDDTDNQAWLVSDTSLPLEPPPTHWMPLKVP